MLSLGKKKKNDEIFEDTNDLVIVFDDENKTSKIRRITDFRDGALYVVGEFKIPVQDCVVTNSEEGRHFFYRAPAKSVLETERLAQLEKSTVLRHITEYHPEEKDDSGITKFLIVAIMIGFVSFALSSCFAG